MPKTKTILVTGGSGFIGKNFIQTAKSKFDIVSVSRSSKINGVRNIKLDLNNSNFNFLVRLKPDYVVYLGTISSPKEAVAKPQDCFDSNVTAIQKFLEVAKDLKIKKIVLFSSAVLYKDSNKPLSEDDPINPYANMYSYSKFLLETLAEFYRTTYNLPITVFRLSNTYGPGQSTKKAPFLVPSLFTQALEKGKIEVWNTKPIRDFVYVGDVVTAIVDELAVKESGLFNLSSGKGSSIDKVVRIISALSSSKVTNLNKSVDPPYKVTCSVNKLRTHLGWAPTTSLEDGLSKTYEFFTKKRL